MRAPAARSKASCDNLVRPPAPGAGRPIARSGQRRSPGDREIAAGALTTRVVAIGRLSLSLLFLVCSPASGTAQHLPPPSFTEQGWLLVTTLVGNTDEDPEPEYLAILRKSSPAEEETADLRIRFFDFDAKSRTWKATEITNESQESESRLFPAHTVVTLEDVDHDNRQEILIRSRREPNTWGLMILAKRGAYLRQLFASWEGAPELKDLDGDGIMEILLHAEYVGPMKPEDALFYPAQIFAYQDGAFRRASLSLYTAYFVKQVKAACAEYEAVKRSTEKPGESTPLALFRALAKALLAFKVTGDLEGMRAYYQGERPWLHARLPAAYLRALDELAEARP